MQPVSFIPGAVVRVALTSLFLAFNFAVPAAPARLEQVVVVFKTHFDIGYTDMASNVVQRYRTTMIDNALAVVDASRVEGASAFAWTLPGWPLSKIMEDWPGQTEARRAKLGKAFGESRFVVHALPFTTHTELLEPEDLVRGLVFATRLSRDAGLPLPRDAKMTDVPCHSWFLPTMLRHAGVEFLHLGCNPASRSPRIPLLFWWEGPDGSRLLTMYSAGSYGSELRPPADWPHRTWLALIHTGDNHGPPTPEEVRKLLAEAAKELPGVKVRIGRLSDFADALLREKPNLPTVRGDMPDTWIHGPLSDPQGASLARTTRPLIGAAESLNTHLRGLGLPPGEVSADVTRAWEQSLLYGEHTWGGSLAWAYAYSQKTPYAYGEAWNRLRDAGRFQRLESSWEEHSTYIRNAAQIIQPVLAQQLQALADGVKLSGPRVVIHNPLPWPRNGIARIAAPNLHAGSWQAVDNGSRVKAAREGNDLVFAVEEIPASGYRTFVPVSGVSDIVSVAAEESTSIIESEFFQMVIDGVRGGIVSLKDKRSRRELVDRASPYRLGQVLYERFDADQVAAYVKAYVKSDADWAVTELGKPNLPPASEVPYVAATPSRVTTAVNRTPVACVVTLRSEAGDGVPFPVTTRITLPNDSPWLEIEVTVHDKQQDPWPEAAWICLPVNVEAPRFLLGRQTGLTDPARDIVPGANRDLFAVHTGFTIRDRAGNGLGFCPLDHAVVSLGQPGCWRYTVDEAPRRPVGFVNLFNNQWTTNFRLWNRGTVRSRVRLWATRPGMTSAEALVTPSHEARLPLLAAASSGPTGKLDPKGEGLRISRPGVWVMAFGRNPDGAGTLLRVWEQAGDAGSCTVQLPPGVNAKTALPVDLRGSPNGEALPVRSGKFSAKLKAFAPASFVLTP